jgi:hypothetical protein
MIMQVTLPSHAQVIVPNAVALVKGWLQVVDADRLGSAVVNETFNRWTSQRKFGKRGPFFDRGHTMSRFGDPGVTYSFKGKPKPMYAMTPSLAALQKLVGHTLGWHPNCCVINSYAPCSGLYLTVTGSTFPSSAATRPSSSSSRIETASSANTTSASNDPVGCTILVWQRTRV